MYNILHKVYHSVKSYANRLCGGGTMDIIWYIFDMIGTIAFAVSGALVGGVARKMDIFGMSVLALATAIGGGGIVRDVLLGYFPPNSLRNIVYVTVVIVVTIIVFIIYSSRYRRQVMGPRSRASYLFADAVGLASFTVTGASAGYTLYPDLPIFIVLLGTITAVGGGGIIRDMLAQRIPSVLKEDVYALPSIIGGIVYYVMVLYGWTGQAVYGAFSIVLIIRLLAIKYRWSLPKVR